MVLVILHWYGLCNLVKIGCHNQGKYRADLNSSQNAE